MSKSLNNNFGCSKCCPSKSLYNFSGTQVAVGQLDRSITQFVQQVEAPTPGGGGGGGGGGDGTVPDPLELDNITARDLLQAGNILVGNNLDVGNGDIVLHNNTITSNSSIIVNPTIDFQINPNLLVYGDYTRLDTIETRISDQVPVIGYIDPNGLLALDDHDRGFEFNWVNTTNGINFFHNIGFFGYDKDRDRFVFWRRATIDSGIFATDQNYERSGADLNSLDADVIYTTEIRNPDYTIGNTIPRDITIDADDEITLFSNLEEHITNDMNLRISDEEIHTIGQFNIPNTGRYKIVTEDTTGNDSRIELNNKNIVGTPPGLYLYHPDLIDLRVNGPSGLLDLFSENDIRMRANDNIIISSLQNSITMIAKNVVREQSISDNFIIQAGENNPGVGGGHVEIIAEVLGNNAPNSLASSVIDGDIYLRSTNSILLESETDVRILPKLKVNEIESFNVSDTIVFNSPISATSNQNSVAADRLIFNGPVVHNITVAPVANGGVIYYDGSNIRSVTDVPVVNDFLSYNGAQLVWVPGGSSLQSAYDAGDSLLTDGVIELNNTVGKVLIKENDVVLDRINGILFQVSDFAGGLSTGDNFFSINNSTTPATIIFGEAGTRSVMVSIIGEDTIANTVAFRVQGENSGTNYFRVIPNPANDREVVIIGDLSVSNVIVDFDGLTFGSGIISNPSLAPAEASRTIWYHDGENRVKIDTGGSERPLTLSPDTIATANVLVKLVSSATSHLLVETGLTSTASGALTVSGQLNATSTTNNVAADRLLFGATTRLLDSTAPTTDGSVLFYDTGPATIRGVANAPSMNDILVYSATGTGEPEWSSGSGTITLQFAYDNYTGSQPAHIILTGADSTLDIRDSVGGESPIFRIEDSAGVSLFEVEDDTVPTSAEVKIADNLSVGSVGSSNTGNILLRVSKYQGSGIISAASLDTFATPVAQGEGTIWVQDNGIQCGSRPQYTDYDPSGPSTTTYNIVLDNAAQIISNKLFVDQYLLINASNCTTTETGGIVIPYSATGTTRTVSGGGFTSSSTVFVGGGGPFFGAGDIILICDANKPENNGFFEVSTHAAGIITIDTTPNEPFSKASFSIDTTAVGTVAGINVTIMRTGTDGIWETGRGNMVPINYKDLSSARASYMLFSNSIDVCNDTYTTIAFFPWDDSRFGSSGLDYTNGTLVYYVEIPVNTFDLDIRVVDSTVAIVYALSTGISTNGIQNLVFTSHPTSDDYLQIQVRRSGVGPCNPLIISCILEFDPC